MRNLMRAAVLAGSVLAGVSTLTLILADNPASDSIPDLGSISIPADVGNAPDDAPPAAASEGLTTAEASGAPGDPAGQDAGIPAAGSIPVPANAVADGHAPAAVPPPGAEDGLATAAAAGPPLAPPEAIPDSGSIAVPVADAAVGHAAEAAPPEAASTGLSTAQTAASPS